MTPGDGRDDVAAELRALRTRVAETDAIARESAGLLAETAPKVFQLEEHVAALHGTVTALLAHAGAEDTPAEDPAVTAAKSQLGLRPEPPGPWCWPLLDAVQATAAWDALGRWVGEVLVPTYELTRGQLPECWPHHPRLVTELSWLRHGYLEAHTHGAPAQKAADWHLRQLPGVLAATQVLARRDPDGCGPGYHLGRCPDQDQYLVTRREAEPLRPELWRDAWHEAKTTDLIARRPCS